jgi:nicotinate-nucleotide pyrophosphorylase (carboxylating)
LGGPLSVAAPVTPADSEASLTAPATSAAASVAGLTWETARALEAVGLDAADVVRVVRAALDEDFRYGADVTSAATVAGRTVTAEVVAREAGVLSGGPVALAVLELIADYFGQRAEYADGPAANGATGPPAPTTAGGDGNGAGGPSRNGAAGPKVVGSDGNGAGEPSRNGAADPDPDGAWAVGPLVAGTALVADGSRVAPGTAVLRVSGDADAVLGAERTILNFLTHLSGIATATRTWADAVAGTGAVIRDTRKTLPGLRGLEKYAVRCGGGHNHRMGLGDAALVKDNHVAAAGGIGAAVRAVYAAARPGLVIEVECDSVDQVREALAAGARFILLDNMPVPVLREAVAVARGYDGVRLEASGGLWLSNARAVAETGVDYLAVGALTHSARVLDLGLDYSGSEDR